MQYENGTKGQICRGATARGKLMPPVLPIFEVARALEVEHEEDDEEASEVEHEDEEASGARAVVEEEEDSGAVSPSRGGGWPAAASIAAIKSRASTKSSLGIAAGCPTGGCGAAPRLVGSDIIMPPPCIMPGPMPGGGITGCGGPMESGGSMQLMGIAGTKW